MELFTENFKKESKLSKIDARVKILTAIALLIMVLSYKGFAFPLVLAGLCLAVCIAIRIPLRIFLLRFSEPLFLIVVVVLIKFLFSGRDALFSFTAFGYTVAGYRDGLLSGLMIAARMLGAVSIIALLGFTTAFTDILAGLSWLRMPKGLIEILMFAYRYIFVLLEEALVIYNAQKNRLGYSNVRRGLSSFGTLAGSLTLRAFEHSQSTTVAMVQRGYDGTIPTLNHKPFKLAEVVVSILLLIIMGAAWKI